MATQQQDLTDWYWGEDRVFQYTITDAGAQVNITGWAIKWELRANEDDSVALLVKSTGNGGIVLTNPTAGVLEVRIAKADTDPAGSVELPPGTYKYGLARTDSGQWNVMAVGQATLSKAAVRP
jgi:hypothetical protein